MVEAPTNLATMFLQFMLICLVSNTLYFAVASRCYEDEYRIGLECCPACPPGMHVERDCTEISTTKCTDCTNGTFQEGLNGQKQCSTCTKCDTGLGLKVKKSCTSTSDALCEPLDGYFCSDSNRGRCMAAQRHTVCSPGQYISQRGTADKDTECLQCTDGTFSDGTSSCQPHTICDSVGGVQIKPGTDSADSTCIKKVTFGLSIVGLLVVVVMTSIIGAWLYRRCEEKRERERYAGFEQRIREMTSNLPELERKLTAWAHLILDKETPEQKRELTAWAHLILETFTPEQKSLLTAFEKRLREMDTREQNRLLTDVENTPEAGEEASDLPSPPLLSPELPEGHPTSTTTSSTPATSSETQPAGQATSSTPATSSETQPATETTPLMSSDSPEPTTYKNIP